MSRRVLALVALVYAPAIAVADPLEEACLNAVGALNPKAAVVSPDLEDGHRVAVHFESASDATLAAVGKLPAVGSLKIDDASLCTEKGFAVLRELPNLQVLVLGRSTVTDRIAATIGDMKTIQELYLGQSRLTDAGLAVLKPLAGLRSLDVYDDKVSDAGLKHLAAFAQLEELNLAGTKVSDRGIAALAGIKSLKKVQLNRTEVTRAGISKLELAHPKLTVRY